VLFPYALEGDAPKGLTHLASSSKACRGTHLAMRFGLSADSIRCGVEHAET
jgi:hypothetical protein